MTQMPQENDIKLRIRRVRQMGGNKLKSNVKRTNFLRLSNGRQLLAGYMYIGLKRGNQNKQPKTVNKPGQKKALLSVCALI